MSEPAKTPSALIKPGPSLYPTLWSGMPKPNDKPADSGLIPTDDDCFRWWDEYGMLDQVRSHSLKVGEVATLVASAVRERVSGLDLQSVRASALLHDLGKTYGILYGGNHAQLGGAWTYRLTKNPLIAAGVLHHVFWPWEADVGRFALPLIVLYADKRVMHDRVVSVGARYSDLFERYGKTESIRRRMRLSMEQGLLIERELSKITGVELHACTFTGGRLVG